MGVLYYGVNHIRKEIFCLGKNGKYVFVEPIKKGRADDEIVQAELDYIYGAKNKDWLTSVVCRIREFGVDEALHEDWMDSGQVYDDYTYVDSVYEKDVDMFGKTVLQYNEEL